jgi:hypothetical protein
MLVFNEYFYKSKKWKLYLGDRVTVLNDFVLLLLIKHVFELPTYAIIKNVN